MIDLNGLPLPALFDALTGDDSLERLLALARDEDLGAHGDLTTASLALPARPAAARLVAREPGVLAGGAVIPEVLRVFGRDEVHFQAVLADGAMLAAGAVLGRLRGPWADLLAIERTILNLIGRLSGVATQTRRFVDAVAGTGVAICETRKTTPGLRGIEKYAVRCGGGTLHRRGLFDAALYKDNHLAAAGPDWAAVLARAIERVGAQPLRFVMVEVDTLAQLDVVLGMEGVDYVLLDNMTNDDLRAAVARRDAQAPQIQLEASGGIRLETVAAIAATGIDRLSIGALTHGVRSLDIGLDAEDGRSPMADVAALRDALAPTVAAAAHFDDLVVVDTVDSTQDEVRRRAAPAGTILVTLRQAAGHGRLGSVWADTGAEGLAVSAVVLPVGSAPAWSPERLAIASAVATAEAIEAVLGRTVGIKWPNDVMAGGGKLAGILIEGDPQRAVIGIGINVHQTTWPSDLAPRAVSLAQLGASTTRRRLGAGLIAALDIALGLHDTVLTAAFSGRDVLVGRTATFRTHGADGPEVVRGRVERLDPLTGLGVRSESDQQVRWLPAASTRVLDA